METVILRLKASSAGSTEATAIHATTRPGIPVSEGTPSITKVMNEGFSPGKGLLVESSCKLLETFSSRLETFAATLEAMVAEATAMDAAMDFGMPVSRGAPSLDSADSPTYDSIDGAFGNLTIH